MKQKNIVSAEIILEFSPKTKKKVKKMKGKNEEEKETGRARRFCQYRLKQVILLILFKLTFMTVYIFFCIFFYSTKLIFKK